MNYIYVCFFEGDVPGQYDWFSVFPSKKAAMSNAKSFKNDRKIIYLRYDPDKYRNGLYEIEEKDLIVVLQLKDLYSGA